MEKPHSGPRRIALLIFLILPALLLSTTTLSADPGDGSVKDSFKKMGKAIGQAGKQVGKSAAAAGKAVGHESQKIWYRGVRVSKPALEKARGETRRAIQRSLDAMDRSIASLRQELRRLNAAEAGRGQGGSGGDDE